MGLVDRTRSQFIGVIEWVDPSRETLAWRPGLQEWLPTAPVAELQSLLARVPPPLPPPVLSTAP
jgi:hypothetical protein